MIELQNFCFYIVSNLMQLLFNNSLFQAGNQDFATERALNQKFNFFVRKIL